MSYKKIKDMIDELSCEELEVEDEKVNNRKDIEGKKAVEEKIKKTGCLLKNHLKNEICLSCNLPLEECPMKNDLINEMKKER